MDGDRVTENADMVLASHPSNPDMVLVNECQRDAKLQRFGFHWNRPEAIETTMNAFRPE